jgi:hypothetical protein
VSDYDIRHARSFIEFLTKPRPFLPVFHFLKRKVNRLPKNLSDALLGRVLRAVTRYAPAKFRHHRFEGLLISLLHAGAEHGFCLSTGEVSSTVMANANKLLRLPGELSAASLYGEQTQPVA